MVDKKIFLVVEEEIENPKSGFYTEIDGIFYDQLDRVEITSEEFELLKQGLQAFAMSKQEKALLTKLSKVTEW